MSVNCQLWSDAQLITMTENGHPYGLIENGAVVEENGNISWLGKMDQVPEKNYRHVHDCGGRFLSPGLIDCHTHILYAGERVREFEIRLNGISYSEIAESGGGILATVNATRHAGADELIDSTLARLQHFIHEGVTTVEIKSGYGLDSDTEIKMLRAVQQLRQYVPLTIEATFLGAHAVPPEHNNNPDAYIDLVCNEMIPVISSKKLATSVDVFCESIAFTSAQTERVFKTAKSESLQVKLHADQLSDSGGAALAAKYDALSADHLEYTSEAGIKAMAKSNTVAVLLPGAFYTLGETRLPPVDLLRKYNVPIAIASDSNPGSSPVLSLRLMCNMACTLFKLSPEEAIKGVTVAAAAALGLEDKIGSLQVGKKADFALWDINHPAELAYAVGGNLCKSVIKEGVIIQ